MSFIVWIVFGAIAGWLASIIMKEDNGLIRNILIFDKIHSTAIQFKLEE